MQMPQSHYVLPFFVEYSGFGAKESNPYNKFFEERTTFLGSQADDTAVNDIMVQLLVPKGLDPDHDITMYTNFPGGSFTSLTVIYDTMQYVRPDVQAVCLGQAASAAVVLLAMGVPGKCITPPNARVLIHQPATQGIQGQVPGLEIQTNEIERMRKLMEETLTHHSDRTAEQVHKDTDRDKILTTEEAVEYGIINQALEYRKHNAQSIWLHGLNRKTFNSVKVLLILGYVLIPNVGSCLFGLISMPNSSAVIIRDSKLADVKFYMASFYL